MQIFQNKLSKKEKKKKKKKKKKQNSLMREFEGQKNDMCLMLDTCIFPL